MNELDLKGIESEFSKNTGFKFAGGDIGSVVSEIIKYAIPFAGLVLLLYLLSAGFQFMTAAGDPKAIEAAKQKLTNSLIGFVVVFASYWIVQIVGNVLGLESILKIF